MHGADIILILTVIGTELLAAYHHPKTKAEKLSAYRENRAQNIPVPEKQALPTPLPEIGQNIDPETVKRSNRIKKKIEAEASELNCLKEKSAQLPI